MGWLCFQYSKIGSDQSPLHAPGKNAARNWPPVPLMYMYFCIHCALPPRASRNGSTLPVRATQSRVACAQRARLHANDQSHVLPSFNQCAQNPGGEFCALVEWQPQPIGLTSLKSLKATPEKTCPLSQNLSALGKFAPSRRTLGACACVRYTSLHGNPHWHG
jgi:hypothetical protein